VGSKKGAFLTAISVIVALTVAMVTVQSTQASIDYWLQRPDNFTQGLNQITVYCKNGGGMDGDFYLVVKFTNATFSTQTAMPYSVDDSHTTAKLKFTLHKDDSSSRTVYFWLNETQGFAVSVSLESASLIEFIKANDLYPTDLAYVWDNNSCTFNCTNPL
jgi:hypothetical protein